MDGLLLDTEDKYTQCVNTLLAKYGRPPLPWSIKAQLQGRPFPQSQEIFHKWAQLPIAQEQYALEVAELQRELFPSSQPLPGVVELLSNLNSAKVRPFAIPYHVSQLITTQVHGKNEKIHLALATSSHRANFKLKSDHLGNLFSVFTDTRRVLGDDPRIPKGQGKPAPDIYLLALKMVNETLPEGEAEIKPEECLVFEDSVPGVEAGRRAGMQVVWCPHPELRKEFAGREKEVLAGRVEGQTAHKGEHDDGWAREFTTLENFPYAEYGIEVQK